MSASRAGHALVENTHMWKTEMRLLPKIMITLGFISLGGCVVAPVAPLRGLHRSAGRRCALCRGEPVLLWLVWSALLLRTALVASARRVECSFGDAFSQARAESLAAEGRSRCRRGVAVAGCAGAPTRSDRGAARTDVLWLNRITYGVNSETLSDYERRGRSGSRLATRRSRPCPARGHGYSDQSP